MEKPTEILSEEHKNILKVINAVENECNKLSSGEELDVEFFKKAISFIREYADKFHHAKEEEILFVELCKDTVEMHCNPTQQMLHEHNLGRELVKGMEEGLNEKNVKKVVENSKGYAALLKEHIYKEDNILYLMADEVLSEETQKEMFEKFVKVGGKFSEEFEEKWLKFVKSCEER